MAFAVTMFVQEQATLPASIQTACELCGFQRQEDDEGPYLSKSYVDCGDMFCQLLELAPNLQLDVHLSKDSIYFFQHAEVGIVVVEIHRPARRAARRRAAAPREWMLAEHRSDFVGQRCPQLAAIRSLQALRSSVLSELLGHAGARLSMPAHLFVWDQLERQYQQITADLTGALSVQSRRPEGMVFCTGVIASQWPYLEVLDARSSHSYCLDDLVLCRPQARHLLGVPICHDGAKVGVLCAAGEHPATKPMRSRRRKLLQEVAARLEHVMQCGLP